MEGYIVSNIATDSIMAEYHRELAKQYNIFSIDDSYGSKKASLENTEKHLARYLEKNFNGSDFLFSSFLYRDFLSLWASKSEVEGVLYLSDEDGGVFRRRAYEAIKDDCGITLLSELKNYITYIEENDLEEMDLTGEVESLQSEISEVKIPEGEYGIIKGDTASVYSPMFIYGFVEDTSKLSENTVDKSQLFSTRKSENMINSGNLKLEEIGSGEKLIEKFAFDEYLMRYMGSYMKEGNDNSLEYQIEYILNGYPSDIDNLVGTVGRIFGIRFAADFLYLLSDKEKCDIAEAMAVVISVITYTEEFIDVYKMLILLIWANMEAQWDVRCLMAGSRIQMVKTKESWYTDLGQLADSHNTKGDESGLSYEDYLRIFLLMTGDHIVNARAMDMVEADIRKTPGNEDFRIDACIDTVAVNIEIQSKFGYLVNYHIKRKYE
ncbi:MAG: DUF5702 domain-containing protein [Lachnospiraceae bacterium]|nr:DUF5702 domain-containing protein [Lachnospiraceae bacterium]